MDTLPDLHALERARAIVYRTLQPTPQYAWPLLAERVGARIWVKHENHTPTGAFKVRGGLVHFDALAREARPPDGVITATRGNHGQSVAFAARAAGVPATIVVPHGNSREKNAAMRAFGARVVEHGDDFQAAREHAIALAARDGLRMVPSFAPDLVAGVASYWLEFFEAVPQVDVVYVPIGLGSGACAAIAARDALRLHTRIVGVVSAHAPTYALSVDAGRVVEAPVSTVLADGMACRVAEADAVMLLRTGLERLVRVTDDEVALAMKQLFTDTHNTAEGAGAAALAAALQERARIAGRTVGIVLSGGNVDHDVFAQVLQR
ncbi:MAG TPA: threonine dehydratase [Quisquiliibacterium sp.]|nr:threonine dehydratase [Quisquiliibacterium sp.]HQN13549.1 threonine dehydratase [Quisquiliibacterium sp.]